jgi:hypothetical protein
MTATNDPNQLHCRHFHLPRPGRFHLTRVRLAQFRAICRHGRPMTWRLVLGLLLTAISHLMVLTALLQPYMAFAFAFWTCAVWVRIASALRGSNAEDTTFDHDRTWGIRIDNGRQSRRI